MSEAKEGEEGQQMELRERIQNIGKEDGIEINNME